MRKPQTNSHGKEKILSNVVKAKTYKIPGGLNNGSKTMHKGGSINPDLLLPLLHAPYVETLASSSSKVQESVDNMIAKIFGSPSSLQDHNTCPLDPSKVIQESLLGCDSQACINPNASMEVEGRDLINTEDVSLTTINPNASMEVEGKDLINTEDASLA